MAINTSSHDTSTNSFFSTQAVVGSPLGVGSSDISLASPDFLRLTPKSVLPSSPRSPKQISLPAPGSNWVHVEEVLPLDLGFQARAQADQANFIDLVTPPQDQPPQQQGLVPSPLPQPQQEQLAFNIPNNHDNDIVMVDLEQLLNSPRRSDRISDQSRGLYVNMLDKAVKKKQREDELLREEAAKKAKARTSGQPSSTIQPPPKVPKRVIRNLSKEQVLRMGEECGFGDQEKLEIEEAANRSAHV